MTVARDEPLEFVVEADDAGRADRLVKLHFPGASRRRLATLFATGAVRVDGKRAKKGTMVAAGATVKVVGAPHSDEDLRPVAEAADLEILFEDDSLLAVNKPEDCPSHPLHVGEVGTVANWLMAHAECFADASPDNREAGLVHRLDRHTTGVLVAAKNRSCWEAARDSFRQRRVTKEYVALVIGDPPGRFTIDLELETRGSKARVAPGLGLEAHTSFATACRHGDYALVHCRATTGRMHQIRAHLAAAGHSIVGDTLYSGSEGPSELTGHFLHAISLTLPHPATDAPLAIAAGFPPSRLAVLTALGFDASEVSASVSEAGRHHQEAIA